MEKETQDTPVKKKRPRIPLSERAQTFTQSVITRPNKIEKPQIDMITALQKTAQNPEEFYRNNPQMVRNILNKFISEKEKANLSKNTLSLLQKYKSAIWRKYVYLAAREDIKNLLTATPSPLPEREDDVRLECMEQLKKLSETQQIRPEQYQYLHQTYFSDIISKDNLPQAQVSKMLRCMASGKFYAPKDINGKIDKKKFSPAFMAFLKQKKKPKINAQINDYDFFGLDENKQPKSPVWHAVKDSHNFQKMKPIIAKRCIDKGISPEMAYHLTPADYWLLLSNSEEAKDIKFKDICPQVNDAPFEEFAVKLGKILSVGGALEMSKDQKIKLWLNNFASKQEKADFESEHSPDFKTFLKKCERIYQKLEQDLKDNQIHPKFMSLWVESMLKNKSINPSLVDCPHKPHKIDIHHWDRLSSVSGTENLAQKNCLDNFGVMIMYQNYSFDIHAQEHKGESAHFVKANREETTMNKNRRFLFATSNCVYISDDLMHETTDFHPLEKESFNLNLTIDKQRA